MHLATANQDSSSISTLNPPPSLPPSLPPISSVYLTYMKRGPFVCTVQRLIYAQKGHTHTHTQLSVRIIICMCVSHHTTAFIRSTDVVGAEGIGRPLKLFSLIALACVYICAFRTSRLYSSGPVKQFLTSFYNRPRIVSPPT